MVPDYPLPHFRGVLLVFVLETLCFSLRCFARTLESQMLEIRPLDSFLYGKL